MSERPELYHIPGASQDITGFPAGKISETLVEFASPLVELLERPIAPDPMRQSLLVAVLVWNSVVLAEWGLEADSLDRARQLLRAVPEAVRRFLFDELILRKRRRFASDRRLIGYFEVHDEDGELRVRADACLPRLDREET